MLGSIVFSFSNFVNADGSFLVYDTTKECYRHVINDGIYVLEWEALEEQRKANPKNFVSVSSNPVSLEEWKTSCLSALRKIEDSFLDRGVILVTGLEVDANTKTLDWLRVIDNCAPSNRESSELRFILADNSVVNISYTQLDAIKNAVNKYLLDVHIGKQTVRNQIEAATSLNELPSITVEALGRLVENFVRLKD